MTNIMFVRVFDIMKRIDILFRFTADYKREQASLKVLHGFTNSVIDKRIKELDARKGDENELNRFDDLGIKKKVAFLDLLLEARIDGFPLSREEIREEVDTFMFAGHDTTASALAFAFYNLALHPEIQQKVYDEIENVVGGTNETRKIQTMNELKYLELVIKETLRLYPSAAFFSRFVKEEIVVGGVTIPANCQTNLSPFLMGRNADIFNDPLKFDPMRFAQIDEARSFFSYVPFSAGPRNCEYS